MTSSSSLILQHYIKLTEFLGKALGPDYEVALHDLTRKDRSIIAIANNYISGREVGAPLTNMALSILRDKSYEHTDYHLHYYSINVNGKDLRSSTFFIKDNGKLIGLLCINFDDSRYRDVCDRILSLCHPDLFVTDVLAQPLPENEDGVSARSSPEKFRNSADAVALDAINREQLNAAENVPVVNTVGAGDSYIAAFTYGVSLGESIPQCMARGKALATRIVQQFEPYLI